MSFSINQVIVGGKLVKDPELKFTKSGKAVCTLTIVTEVSQKKGEEWVKIPSFHKIVIWGGIGEYVGNNAIKGEIITVSGRINYRDYQPKGSNDKRYITEIVANDVVYGGKKKELVEDMSTEDVESELNVNDIPF